jgi:hypothetical protein
MANTRGTYKVRELKKAKDLIKNSTIFSGAAPGFSMKRKDLKTKLVNEYPKEEILKDGTYNLYKSIRKDAVEYFTRNKISLWHIAGEPQDKPTGHVLSSQIACLNHLFPIRNDKDAVLSVAQQVCPDFVEVLPINTDNFLPAYIAFEVVSNTDHLNEGYSTRGANCTSVDALIYAVHKNGLKYILPIEWKYTETYTAEDKACGEKGEIRRGRYDALIKTSKYLKPSGENGAASGIYYYEPFYQLMRQTLWAEQMLANKNSEQIKADEYIHVHVIPQENDGLLKKHGTGYIQSGKDLETTWKNQLKDPNKYKIITPESLLNGLNKTKYDDLLKYLTTRYWKDTYNFEEFAIDMYRLAAWIPNEDFVEIFFEQAVNFAYNGQLTDAIEATKTALFFAEKAGVGYKAVYIIGMLCEVFIDNGELENAQKTFELGMEYVERGKDMYPDDYEKDMNSFLDLKVRIDGLRK